MPDTSTVRIGAKQSQMLTEIATREGNTKRGVIDALVEEYYREFHAGPISQRDQQNQALQGLQTGQEYQPSGGATHATFSNEPPQNESQAPQNGRDENVVFDL